ncbi:MAG TPA: hypothetical protein ENI56_00445 [Candidatus Kaiserbacteria bacterium]|nr:hypothetical protein [Candidatus Kaiserbacteria bacterium]
MRNIIHNASYVSAADYWQLLYTVLMRATIVMLFVYIGLLAFVMSYGVVSMRSAQIVQDTRARIGTLETSYLNKISEINDTQPSASGFEKPVHIGYVVDTRPAVSIRTP